MYLSPTRQVIYTQMKSSYSVSTPHVYHEIKGNAAVDDANHHLDELHRIEQLPYFHQLNRVEAEDILVRYAKQPGVFLLRWSSMTNKIAVTTVVCKGRIAHTVIFAKRGTYYMENDIRFSSIEALITYYSCFGIPAFSKYNSNARLTTPIIRFCGSTLPAVRDSCLSQNIHNPTPMSGCGNHYTPYDIKYSFHLNQNIESNSTDIDTTHPKLARILS
uniref:uncharacterized protein LOC104265341 n=1 Tax=Ciona intestinalis TaxID=7719 RepID=UPI00089DC0CD|nr:uncharacterized protein LOC104265341 [Ciona intestinalis]|eukprot:XP_009857410.2 uncharacterized protein LOC104265341 [Ciona intestinalis]